MRRIRKLTMAMALAIGAMPAAANTVSAIYVYDQAGRLTNMLYSNGLCVIYVYDAAGNRTERRVTITSGTPTWGTIPYGCFRWST